MGRLRDLAELVRAPAALSVPGDLVAGAGAAAVLGADTAGLAAASVGLYWAGMAANDWADRGRDAVERPERPIPSGRVRPGTAFGVAAGLTAASLTVAGVTGGRRALAVAVPLAACVWAYDLALKETAAGPAAMAACRGLNVLLGAARRGSRGALPSAALVAAHTYAVTALSRDEVRGTRPQLPAATLVATAVVAAGSAVRSGRLAAVLAGGYLTSFGVAQARAIGDPCPATVRAAVRTGITSLPMLQAALTARAGAPLAALAVAASAPLGRRLARVVTPT
ncbi:SCO3242 family prenyltransferase [Mangrovihabitans endophyticus]|uniref:Transferase n=1 Tax=Mangrovihabitans endophyticus TaxID=1751298 RepID=A0A8J3BSC7_9ACTN|nr:UbiA family prenyltransferase [Mangrovihabitans endophyticus]GGK73230.1 transferase [Mangrovihabitans endophyticus]